MLEWQSPLAPSLANGGRDGTDGRRALKLAEVRGWQLAQIALHAVTAAQSASAIEAVLGVTLPAGPGVSAAGAARLYRLAPRQYWVLSPDAVLVARIGEAAAAAGGACHSQSQGRVRVAVSGASVEAMLKRVLTVDPELRAFPVGHALQTGLHHVGVLVERIRDDRFEFFLPRTYARSCWECLADAAWSFGYDVDVEQT